METGLKAAHRIRDRKSEHMELALRDAAPDSSLWSEIDLVHDAIPSLDLAEVDLTTEFLGHRLHSPVVIAGMTGGHSAATPINAILARAAQKHMIGLGVGSQRAALADPTLSPTYAITREEAPDALIIGNIGVAQLVDQPNQPAMGLEHILLAADMIEADALAIHLNFLEELIQPEGDRCSSGCSDAIERIASQVEFPVLAKETGAGISRSTAEHLTSLGVAALDIGGAGGTNFASIESARAEHRQDQRSIRLGRTFRDWGIPTPVSILGARSTHLPVIATGGIRSGLDAAKALALGATVVGIGRPLLVAALEGDEAVDLWLEGFKDGLRAAMWLTGCRQTTDLPQRPLVVGGHTRRWLDDLGYRLGDRQ